MEQFWSSVSLGFLLRSLFAGAFGVVSYLVASSGINGLKEVSSNEVLTIVLPVSLFVGVHIYGVHRSLLYPWFEWILSLSCIKKVRKCIPLISNTALTEIVDLWKREPVTADQMENRLQRFAKQISEWADYAHLQYTSAWAIGAGTGIGKWTSPPCVHHSDNWLLLALAILFVVAAMVSDWRLRRLREWYVESSPR